MNKEQIIETINSIANRNNITIGGIWSDLKHQYRRTIILVTKGDWRVMSRALDPVINGLESIDGKETLTAGEQYSSGYESCELTVVDSYERFNKLLEINKGVNWI